MRNIVGIGGILGTLALILLLVAACATPTARAPTATPTKAPPAQATKEAQPTIAPARVPTPTATLVTLQVGNTDGAGAFIRRTPTITDKIRAWPDGTQMLVVGDEQQSEGIAWKNVRDPDGNVGWVPSQYLVAAVATVSPPPSPFTAPRFHSGGLGLTRSDWEAIHGSGSKDNSGWFHYANEAYVIDFASWSTPEYSAWHIERQWGWPRPKPVPLDEARSEARSLIPTDSKLVKTYTTQQGRLVDLYFSESLKRRFPARMFIGGEPGNFIVLYRPTNPVDTMIIGIGNNP